MAGLEAAAFPLGEVPNRLWQYISRGDRIRTCDILDPNQALFQTELHPVGCYATYQTGERCTHLRRYIAIGVGAVVRTWV
jgi:hypothetical protein